MKIYYNCFENKIIFINNCLYRNKLCNNYFNYIKNINYINYINNY